MFAAPKATLTPRATLRERLRRGQHGPPSVVALVSCTVLAWLRVEPFATWYFVCAWYPVILCIDAWVARRRGASLLSDRPLALLSLACWSVPFWLLFELINVRLENWYYIGAPRDPLHGRILLIASFATVLPALVEAQDLLSAYGCFSRARLPRLLVNQRSMLWLFGIGWLMLLLAMAWPRHCYPLVWGFLVLLLEPFNRRPRWPSLLRDLELGRATDLLRWLAAGMICGLIWEALNMPARARWIYTVPLFDRVLGVEMPPIGFLGFAPFALEAWSFVRALEILGMSVPIRPIDGAPRVRLMHGVARLLVVPVVVSLFSIVCIHAVETHTVDAGVARLADLRSVHPREAAALAIAGLTHADDLVHAAAGAAAVEELSQQLNVPRERVDEMVTEARVAALRGIGSVNALRLYEVGIDSVEHLAASEPVDLYRRLVALDDGGRPVRPQRVRVWVLAARRQD